MGKCTMSSFIIIIILCSSMMYYSSSWKVCHIITQKASFLSMIGLHILFDIFVDITGHQIDWYDKEDGWTEDRRKKIWNLNILTLDQWENLPAYTKSGYKKMSIPIELHNLILKTLKMKSTKYIDEELNEDDTIRNCQ